MFKYDLIDLKTVDKTLQNKQLAKNPPKNPPSIIPYIITTESKF